jgi:hypothetical protein
MKRLLVVVCLLLAGCAAPPAAGKPPATFAPAELVLQVRSGGGLMPIEASVTGIAEFSLYGDGRLITTGPTLDIYPGPALPNMEVRRVSGAEVAALARRALDAGVGNGEDTGTPQVEDAPTTRITVRTSAGPVSTDVLALGLEAGELSRAQRAARERMKDLVDELRNLPAKRGPGRPYEPARIAAVAGEWRPSADGLPSDPPAVPWPGDAALPGAPVPGRTAVNCLVVDAGPVLAAARGANARTPWLSGDARWSVRFRPLLPDEATCTDLTR